MIAYACTFDGHDIAEFWSIEYHMTRTLPTWSPTLVEVPANGALFGGTRAEPVTITMQLVALDDTRDGRQEALRTLAGWLAVDEPRPLYLGDEGGRYRLAVPTDEAPIEPFLNADSVEITFTCPDPLLHGATQRVTVPSGGSVSIRVGGTAPARPTITASAATGSAGGAWSVVTEDGGGIYAAIAGGSSKPVFADVATRVLKVDGTVTMLNASYDWPTLTPGTHTLTMTQGTGAAIVEWEDLWW